MASLLEEINTMKASGVSNALIEDFKNKQILELQAAGVDDSIINKSLGIVDRSKDDSLLEPIKKYWSGVAQDIKNEGLFDYAKKWSVGEQSEFLTTHLDRGIGKMNINLMMQYHTSGKKGIDYKSAFAQEPADTGHLERAFETLVTLGGDSPFYIPGIIMGAMGSPVTGGFVAGFVNDSIKGMYLEALDREEVSSFKEWWQIFLHHGLWEGTKGGTTVASMVAAPSALPFLGMSKNMITKFMARWTALSYTPVMLGEDWPDKNQKINNALMLASLGIVEKGASMVFKRGIKNKKDLPDNTKDIFENKDMIEDAVSFNKKTFRADKKIDESLIRNLNKELIELRKEKPKKEEIKLNLKELENKQQKTFEEISKMREDKAMGLEIDQAKFTALEKELGKIEIAIKEFKPEAVGKVETKEITELKAEIARLEDLKTKDPNKIPMKEYITLEENLKTAKEKLDTLTKVEKPIEKDVVTEDITESINLFNQLEKFVENIRKTNPDKMIENQYFKKGKDFDPDRGIARYIDKHLSKLPNKLDKLLMKQNVKDLETGEIINAGKDGVRGGHIGQLRKLVEEQKFQKEEAIVAEEVTEFQKKSRIQEIERKLDELEAKPVEKVTKNITDVETTNSIIKSALKKLRWGKIERVKDVDWKTNLIRHFLDGLYPILKAERRAKNWVKFKKNAPTPYTEMRNQHGMIGKAMYFIKYNTLNFKSQLDNGKGFYNIVLDVIEFGKEISDLKTQLRTSELDLRTMKAFRKKKHFADQKKELGETIIALEKEIKQLTTSIEQKTANIKNRNPIDEFAKASAYLKHKRNIELVEKRKIDTGIDIEISKKYTQLKEIKNNYESMRQEVLEYQNRLVDYMVEAGVISAELAQIVKKLNQDYVPFFRVIEDANIGNTFSKTVKNPFKRIKGSEKDIADPIESIFLNTLRFVQIAERNAAYTSFFDMINQAKAEAVKYKKPDPFPEIQIAKSKVRPIKIVKEDLKDIVIDWKGISENIADGFTIFRKDGQMLSETQVAVYKDGVRTIWEMPSDIAQALNGMNKFQAGWIRDYLGWPTRWLRTGATLNPDFIVRNFSRDTFFGAVFSKNIGFLPIYSTLRGMWLFGRKNKAERFRGSEEFKTFMKSGAMQSHLVSIDQKYFRDGKVFDQLMKRKFPNWINPMKIGEYLRVVSEYAEIASRLGDFELTMKRLRNENKKLPLEEQLTEREMLHRGGFEGRDLTIDFRKMGYAIQSVNAISAFYNARIQGNLKLWEGMRDRPIQTSLKIMTYITIPSILLWLHNKDSEAYRRLPRWRKDLAWNLVLNEGTDKEWTASFPKAHGLALIFGSAVERILDSMYKKDPTIFKNFVKEWSWDSVIQTIPMPDFAKPIIEKWANKSYFTQRPIVPEGLKNLLPEYQFTQYTSETAKLLGKVLAKLTFGKMGSPMMIDNWVQSWFGGLGTYMMKLVDTGLEKSGIVVPPVDPSSDNWIKNLDDMIIIKAFVARNPDASSEYLTDFWTMYRPIAKQIATINRLKSQGRLEEYIHLFQKSEVELAFLEKFATAIRKNADFIRKVQASTFMSADDKAQLIDMTYLMMIETAKMANEQVKNMRKFKKELYK